MADQWTNTAQPFGPQLIAGDDWSWCDRLACYPPSQFTLKYFLRGPASEATLDLVASTDEAGTGYITSASSSQTEALPAGVYAWQKCIFDKSDPPKRTELARGAVTLLADISSKTAPYDGRSHNKKVYDAICAVIEGRASRVERQYMIAGRELQLLSPKELEDWKATYYTRVKRELLDDGQVAPDSNLIRAGFPIANGRAGEWSK